MDTPAILPDDGSAPLRPDRHRFAFDAVLDPPCPLEVVSLRGRERMSSPYRFDVVLTGESAALAQARPALLGARALLRVETAGGSAAEVHGLVTRVAPRAHLVDPAHAVVAVR